MKKYFIGAGVILIILSLFTACTNKIYLTESDGCIDKYTILLLHMDGVNGSRTFNDSSFYGKTVTAYGNAKISTEKSKFGGASLYLDGELSSYLAIENNSDFDFGRGDFTVDCWFYITDSSSQKTIFAGDTDWWLGAWFVGKLGNKMLYYASSTGTSWDLISDCYDNVGGGVGSIFITPFEWHHFAYVRKGDVWKGYIDGQQDFTKTVSGSLVNKNEIKKIGLWGNSTYGYLGYIDEFRISKGVARWTENFIPPTAPYGK